ncbi:MAG: sulfatase-like hydrolase/transferase [Lactobacillus sp.]|nr:sulfatase-like hydrolase/transferase [Lactobacillus sp.]
MIFSAICFSLLFKTNIQTLIEQWSLKKSFIILLTLTIIAFITSTGINELTYPIEIVILILFFAWGMFLEKIDFNKKQVIIATISLILLYFIAVYGQDLFININNVQGQTGNWNANFLIGITSPVTILMSICLFVMVNGFIKTLGDKHLEFIMIAAILAQAPNSSDALPSFGFTKIELINRITSSAIFLIALWCLWFQVELRFDNLKFVKRVVSFFDSFDKVSDLVVALWRQTLGFIKKYRFILFNWLWYWLLGLISFFIVSNNLKVHWGLGSDSDLLPQLFGSRFLLLVLTAIFIYAFFAIWYFLTNRYWVSNIITTAVVISWAIANKIKLNLRSEPIYPSELSKIVNIKSLASMVGFGTIALVLIAIMVLIILAIYLERKYPIKGQSVRHRSIWALLSVALFFTPLQFNHEDSIIGKINRAFNNSRPSFLNPVMDVQLSGPIINTLNYVDISKVMATDSDYSKSAIKAIENKYTDVANEINQGRKNNLKNQTIMFNLSESFIDPSSVPGIDIEGNDPIKYIHSLADKNTYGTMLSAGYGGGTANMEWESLTGFNMGFFNSSVTPYTQIVPSHSFFPTIGMSFTYKSAIHPYIGTYYSRVEDYRRFKFNKFVYLGSKYKIIDQRKLGNSNYNSDFTAYANGLKQINARQGGQFINLISMQNHMPYNDWYPNNEYMGHVSGDLLETDAEKSQVATYVKGVQYTDEAVKGFIKKIDKIKKPITVVFYGDHYPGIINQQHISEYPIKLHSTLYFIYSNKYARKHGAVQKLDHNTNFVNTSDFIAMMLEQTNSKVTPYEALLTKVHNELPAITINYDGKNGYELIDQNTGEKVDRSSLNDDQKALIKDYEMVQYDISAGKAYSLNNSAFYGIKF